MIRRLSVAVLSLLAFLPATSAFSDEPDPAKKALDARISRSLFKTIDSGYKIYNGGDPAGCYRLYQGSLTALSPLLDYRPEIKSVVDQALMTAETQADYPSRAITLRKALDAAFAATTPARPLWDRLGGQSAVTAVVHDFVGLAAGDPKVNFLRNGKYKIDAAGVANLEKLLVELVSATTGGPLKYTGRSMKESHKGMGITDAEFGAIAADLIAVLDKYKVPKKEKDELIAIIASTKGDIVEAPGGAPAPPTPPEDKKLWDRLGGEPAVKAVVHDFVALAAADEKVNFLRDGKYKIDAAGVANLEKLLVELISATTGGPMKYTGRTMKESHMGMAISEEEFNAIAADLSATLDKYKVPQKEKDELMAIIASTKGDIVEPK